MHCTHVSFHDRHQMYCICHSHLFCDDDSGGDDDGDVTDTFRNVIFVYVNCRLFTEPFLHTVANPKSDPLSQPNVTPRDMAKGLAHHVLLPLYAVKSSLPQTSFGVTCQHCTDHRGWVVSALASHSGGRGLKFRPGDRLSEMTFSSGFLQTIQENAVILHQIRTKLLPSTSFIIRYSLTNHHSR
jgi:hypothetical protein